MAFADYDDDGRTDVFVANDGMEQFLFHNDGGGKFSELALEAGVAFSDEGKPYSGMGVDFHGCYDLRGNRFIAPDGPRGTNKKKIVACTGIDEALREPQSIGHPGGARQRDRNRRVHEFASSL